MIRRLWTVGFVCVALAIAPACSGGGGGGEDDDDDPIVDPVCGNGTTETGETCDDGNTAAGDGCSATCQTEPTPEICGDGAINNGGAETCDDGNTAAGDGCTDACAVEPGFTCTTGAPSVCTTVCGDGMIVGAETCDDGNTAAGDGCDAACAPTSGYDCTGVPSVCATVCGDGVVAGAEACDDHGTAAADGCSATCTTEIGYGCTGSPSVCATICGDGLVTGPETCDDANLVPDDCCSATCGAETGCESEINDTQSAADPVEVHFVANRVKGFVAPVGDIDYFTLTLPAGPVEYALRAETLDGPFTDTCASNDLDSEVELFDATGVLLAGDDDGGAGYCSRLVRGVPAGTYVIGVRASDIAADDDKTFDYTLELVATVVVCGDGEIAGSETCDDGGTAANDGCDAACAIEVWNEIEPNGTPTEATANGPFTTERLLKGAITPIGDQDYFLLELDQIVDIEIESFDATGIGCTSTDTHVHLFAANGTSEVVSDDDDGANACSKISAATDPGARHLLPGTYFLRVIEFNNDAALAGGYTVRIRFSAVCGDGVVAGSEECDGGATCTASCERVPVCGDGFTDAPEACDDGNTAAGDGCSPVCAREQVCGDGSADAPEACDDGNTAAGDGCDALCAVEVGHIYESEPNNAFGDADAVTTGTRIHGKIVPVGDKDYFVFTLAAPASLRIETFDANPVLDTCVATDTHVRLYGANGTTELINDDDGGNGACSLIDGATAPAAANLPADTYYVSVEEFGNNAALGNYQLVITILP